MNTNGCSWRATVELIRGDLKGSSLITATVVFQPHPSVFILLKVKIIVGVLLGLKGALMVLVGMASVY